MTSIGDSQKEVGSIRHRIAERDGLIVDIQYRTVGPLGLKIADVGEFPAR